MQYVNIKSLRYSLIFVLGFTAQYSTICTYTTPPPPYLIHPSCCSSMSLYPWQTYSEGFINKMVRFHLDGDEKKEDAIVVRVYRDAMEVSPNREKELLCMQVSVPLQWRRMDVMAFEFTGNSTVPLVCSGVHQLKHESSASLSPVHCRLIRPRLLSSA